MKNILNLIGEIGISLVRIQEKTKRVAIIRECQVQIILKVTNYFNIIQGDNLRRTLALLHGQNIKN